MIELKSTLLEISQDLIEIMKHSKEKIKEACFKFIRNRTVL
jgi:hypothetical protein